MYESGSTNRSGGTGELSSSEFKRKHRDKSALTPRNDGHNSSLIKSALSKSHQNIYMNRIHSLTKENTQLKADYEKLQNDMKTFEQYLADSKQSYQEQSFKLRQYEEMILDKDQKIHRMKIEFKLQHEADKKIVIEYANAENYLLELVDEFTNGMRKIY